MFKVVLLSPGAHPGLRLALTRDLLCATYKAGAGQGIEADLRKLRGLALVSSTRPLKLRRPALVHP
jgi:hypothetical protein